MLHNLSYVAFMRIPRFLSILLAVCAKAHRRNNREGEPALCGIFWIMTARVLIIAKTNCANSLEHHINMQVFSWRMVLHCHT